MWEDPSGTNVEVRRVDFAGRALRTSPKFTTGVKYLFHQDFWPDQTFGNPNNLSPPIHTSSSVFCPRAGSYWKLRHQGCNSAQKQVFHCKLRNLGCSFTISSIRIFDQIRHSEIPTTFRFPFTHHHQCSAQGQVLTANSDTKAAILPKSRSSIANSGT